MIQLHRKWQRCWYHLTLVAWDIYLRITQTYMLGSLAEYWLPMLVWVINEPGGVVKMSLGPNLQATE